MPWTKYTATSTASVLMNQIWMNFFTDAACAAAGCVSHLRNRTCSCRNRFTSLDLNDTERPRQFMKTTGKGWGQLVPIKLAFSWVIQGTSRPHPFHEFALSA